MGKFKAKIQVSREHYFDKISKNAWLNSYYQINDILSLKPKSVLIIGMGDGVVCYYLKELGIKVISMDIDQDLKPDVIGDITNIPFSIRLQKFDAVLCAHVLEHVPFEFFDKILFDLSKISKYLVLQLPPSVLQFRFCPSIQPYICDFNIHLEIPVFFWKKYKFNGQHFWQPYRKNHPIQKINIIIKKYYSTIKQYQCPDHHYSYNFILESKV